MSQSKEGRSRGRRSRTRSERGYVHKSPAVCMVLYDPTGRPMPDAIASRIINTVHEIAVANGYLISFTRT